MRKRLTGHILRQLAILLDRGSAEGELEMESDIDNFSLYDPDDSRLYLSMMRASDRYTLHLRVFERLPVYDDDPPRITRVAVATNVITEPPQPAPPGVRLRPDAEERYQQFAAPVAVDYGPALELFIAIVKKIVQAWAEMCEINKGDDPTARRFSLLELD